LIYLYHYVVNKIMTPKLLSPSEIELSTKERIEGVMRASI
jgi:hypothetical protein